MLPKVLSSIQSTSKIAIVFKFALCLLLFGAGLYLLAGSFQIFNGLLNGLENEPFVAFFASLMLAAVVQSHALAFCFLAALAVSQNLSLAVLVPMLFGANLGSTISGSMSNFGTFSRKKDFKRGLALLLSNHFFKLFLVLLFFPVEYYGQWLSRILVFFVPTEPTLTLIFTVQSPFLLLFMFFAGAISLYFSFYLYRATAGGYSQNAPFDLDKTFANAQQTFMSGLRYAFLFQSSGAARAQILTPTAQQKILLKNTFPYILGNNLGITGAGFMAAIFFINYPPLLGLALLNLLLNALCGLLFMSASWPREFVIDLSKSISDAVIEHKIIGFSYVLLVFFLLPFLFMFGSIKGFDVF